MNFLGIEIPVKNMPELDSAFIPLYAFNRAFLKTARKEVAIALERANGEMASYHTFIHGTAQMEAADRWYMDRLVKFLLWIKGGFRIYVSGDEGIYQYLKDIYSPGGKQDFDQAFLADVYGRPFEVVYVDKVPESLDHPQSLGGNWDGCRIGFDAGGSDRKVSAVIDGQTVYSEEVVWFPKEAENPQYQYDGIVSAFRAAASHMPRVDAVGVSSAGIFINNQAAVASIFLKVPKDQFEARCKNMYLDAVHDTFGDIPVNVINDGDVTALAGAVSLGQTNVLGIAMGTCEAGGFVDADGCITGWLNEVTFAPVDANPNAMFDDWSRDTGVGTHYFSQDAVIKLAPAAGITLEPSLSPAQKLKAVQALMEEGHHGAAAIYRSIGTYLAHSLVLYYDFYHYKYVLLLGRVMSGKGGDLIVQQCRHVLEDEYPEIMEKICIALPDERFRRVGQSAAAASLPKTKK